MGRREAAGGFPTASAGEGKRKTVQREERGEKKWQGGRSSLRSAVTSRLSGCRGQPDMMSQALELGLDVQGGGVKVGGHFPLPRAALLEWE